MLLLIALPLAPSSGKVFLSRLLPKGSSIFDTTGAWRRIYQAPLTINGARAILSIHGCDEPLELVKTRLKRSFGSSKKNYFTENGNSFWMSAASGIHSEASERDQLTRLLALAMPKSDKSVIFAIVQSPAEFSKSTTIPPESIFPGCSLLSGSRVETIIKNEETGAALETKMADAAPDIVISEISAKLSRHGWKQIYPVFHRRSGSYGGQVAGPHSAEASPAANYGDSKQCFMIFQRGKALCTLLAGPALRENKTCVTILLKEKMDDKGE